MGTFGCSQKFSCKTPFSQTLCYCETLFCTAISKPTYGRNCAATQAIPSVVLGWSRAISAMLDTPHHGTLAHTILGIWYATYNKNHANGEEKFQYSDHPGGKERVGADCYEFFQINVNKKQSALR